MQFVYDNGVYKAVRITGPSHNLLGLRLSEEECDTEVIALPVKSGETTNVSKEDVLNQAIRGVDSASTSVGKTYYVSEIYYLPSDTDSPEVYKLLANELILRIHNNFDFKML